GDVALDADQADRVAAAMLAQGREVDPQPPLAAGRLSDEARVGHRHVEHVRHRASDPSPTGPPPPNATAHRLPIAEFAARLNLEPAGSPPAPCPRSTSPPGARRSTRRPPGRRARRRTGRS